MRWSILLAFVLGCGPSGTDDSTPPTGEGDTDTDADSDTDTDTDADTDTDTDTEPPPVAPASCLEVLNAMKGTMPTVPDGLYSIDLDGAGPGMARDVWCDMSIDGGGWTTFFSGLNGSLNVFAHFEDTHDTCPDPENHCLLHPAPTLTEDNRILVTCGAAEVAVTVSPATIDYFVHGTQGQWQTNSDIVSINEADVEDAARFWTGDTSNLGWILSAGDELMNRTFASSYNDNQDWDFCNSNHDTSTPIRLMFR